MHNPKENERELKRTPHGLKGDSGVVFRSENRRRKVGSIIPAGGKNTKHTGKRGAGAAAGLVVNLIKNEPDQTLQIAVMTGKEKLQNLGSEGEIQPHIRSGRKAHEKSTGQKQRTIRGGYVSRN